MLNGLMQDDFPLTVAHIRRRAAEVFADRSVLTLEESGEHRSSYGAVGARVDRLGHVLRRLDVGQGTRVASFAWNTQRHLELYLGVPSFGAVLHTLNVRLSDEQLTYIARHAEDQVVFVEDVLAERLAPVARALPSVRHWIVMGDGDASALEAEVSVQRYEDLLRDAPGDGFDWPELDERAAAALCYTSGTTGNPKGVLYSHRSVSLHAASSLFADGVGLSSVDRLLAVVPMFHVNGWGLPFAAPLAGAELVFPGRAVNAETLAELIERERCTMLNGVPTVMVDLLRYADEHHTDLSSLRSVICGGAAVSEALLEGFEQRHAVRIHHAWGMTETSSICTVARPPRGVSVEEERGYRLSQGRVMPWVEMRAVDPDGAELPSDGSSTGEIEVRGPWIASQYFKEPGTDRFRDGWLRTGDVGHIDARGYLRITDRVNDIIKSGGEWISSVQLENALAGHPDVLEAAVVAKEDERWSERPLPCVVARPGTEPTPEQLRDFLSEHVPRWWLPDEFAYVAEIPKTSTGKFDKKALRAAARAGELSRRSCGP